MRKKIIIALCIGTLAASSMVTGCGKKEAETAAVTETPTATPTETATPTPTEVVLKTIGAEDTNAYKIQLKNNTGADITAVTVKMTDETEYPANMLAENDPFVAGEERNLYYAKPAAAEDTTVAANEVNDEADVAAAEAQANEAAGTEEEKALEQGYDVQISFADGTAYVLHAFPFEDMEKGDICLADGIAYLQYESVSSKQMIDTKEAEQAVLDAAAAEAAAQAEAEAKAQAEAEAQAQAEAEAAAQAEADAKAAAQAEAEAQAAREQEESYDDYEDDSSSDDSSYDDSSSDDSGSDDGGSEDGCVGDGLFY